MSYDLKLVNKDIEYAPGGDFSLVRGKDKLKQDIEKILMTRIGTDPGSSQYGSELVSMLGNRFEQDILQGLAGKTVRIAVNYLQSLQFVQSASQEVTYDEVVGDIEALAVTQPSFNSIKIELSIITVSGLRIRFSREIGG
jgi:phage baseplate assembly protein W